MTEGNAGDGFEPSRGLLMKALDGELSREERAEFEELTRADAALRAEYERLARVKHVTEAVRLNAPPDQIWEGYMFSVYRRIERGIGWVLISVGAVVMLSYGLWQGVLELMGDTTVPWYVKGAVLALLVGAVILVVSVAREKFFVHREDPYRNVQR